MTQLAQISMKAYPNVPAVMNISLMQKIRNVIAQDVLHALVVKLRFGYIDPPAWKLVGEFRRELSPKEAHSYAYLLQHADFNASQKDVRAKVK